MPSAAKLLRTICRRYRPSSTNTCAACAPDEPLDDFQPKLGLVVDKAKIAEGGEFNLSGEQYRVNKLRESSYKTFPFDQVCTLEYGASLPKRNRVEGPYPVMGSNGISGYHNSPLVEGPAIVVGRKGSAGQVTYVESACFPIDTTYYVKLVDPDRVDLQYLYHLLKTLDLPSLQEGAGVPGLNRNDVYSKYRLPLPPLEVQKEIVAEIEGYQKVIDGARAVVENYRPQIAVDPEWPLEKLGKIADVTSSKRILAGEYVPTGVPFYRTKEIVELSNGNSPSSEFFISRERFDSLRMKFGAPQKNDILLSAVGTIGKTWVVSDDRDFYFKDGNLLWIKGFNNVEPHFLKYCLELTIVENMDQMVFGAAYKALTIVRLKEFLIPSPPLETQQAIVAEIEAEQALVDANRELITRFEKKIHDTINRVWAE